jgi:16S rRNA (guanine966-N2)-methyltransferase
LQDPGFLSSTGLFFDLVFLDPPYNAGALEPAIKNLAAGGVLAPKALVIIEHGSADPLPGKLFGLQCTDQRKYGKTIVSFLSNMVANGKSDTGPTPGK